MIAARVRPGAISESNSSHLPPSVASKLAKPVMFPLGWSSRAAISSITDYFQGRHTSMLALCRRPRKAENAGRQPLLWINRVSCFTQETAVFSYRPNMSAESLIMIKPSMVHELA
jgi:hypothetical protein